MTHDILALSIITRKIVDLQTSAGNWDYDAYMLGMANGMLLMQAMIEGVNPVFLEAPDKWLCDQDIDASLGPIQTDKG